eukprot:SAG31_NODE_5216_length_2670_cov_1.605212_6_plen_22_part_01
MSTPNKRLSVARSAVQDPCAVR